MNGADVWIETGLMAMEVAKRSASLTEISTPLVSAETSFKDALKVLSMRGQCYRDIVKHGVEDVRQMDFLVEQGRDAVHLVSYHASGEAHCKTGGRDCKAVRQGPSRQSYQ